MIEFIQADERRKATLLFLENFRAVVNVPVVVLGEDGRVIAKTTPGNLNKMFGLAGLYRDNDVGLVLDSTSEIQLVRGPLLNDDAPAFIDANGDYVAVYTNTINRRRPMSTAHVALLGVVKIPTTKWFRPIPDAFAFLQPCPVAPQHEIKI